MTLGTKIEHGRLGYYTVVTDTASGGCNEGGTNPPCCHFVVERAGYFGNPTGNCYAPIAWEKARGPYVPDVVCWYDLTGPDGSVDGTMNGSAAINGTWIDLRVV